MRMKHIVLMIIKGVIPILVIMLCSQYDLMAGPPFATDDPEPVEYQHWEFYVASQHSKTADGWAGSHALLELNYGVIPNVQIHLVAPLAYDAPTHGNTHFGYGDTEIGAK